MGTVFEIAAYGESPRQTSDAIDKAFQEIVRIDDLMSNYKPESPLSTLNRSGSFPCSKRFRRTYIEQSNRPCNFPGFRVESSTLP